MRRRTGRTTSYGVSPTSEINFIFFTQALRAIWVNDGAGMGEDGGGAGAKAG